MKNHYLCQMARFQKGRTMAQKLDLFKEVLPKLDKGDLNFHDNLTEEQAKSVSPFICLKFMSAVKNKKNKTKELERVIVVNEFANKGFFELSKYPDLQYKLLAATGSGKSEYHYFPGKQPGESKVAKFIRKLYPLWKQEDIDLFLEINTKDDIIELAKDYGLQDKELKELKKDLKDHYA